MQHISTPEQWRPIPGYEHYYEVSDFGRVRSLDRVPKKGRTTKGKLLKMPPGGGYCRVNLSIDGKRTVHRVHRLVLLAFVGPLPAGLATRHLNGDSLDNRLANLAYGTYAENNNDILRHGTNVNKNKTHCRYGHELVQPNLVQSEVPRFRLCRACGRARARRQDHPDLDFQAEADYQYWRLMNGDPKDRRFRKTHCKRGHEFTAENTITLKRGARNCRICTARIKREAAERAKAKRQSAE